MAESKPFGAFGFKVQIGDDSGEGYGCFQEVSGLTASINVEEVQEGGVNNKTHKMVTGTNFSNVTLKRGLCSVDMYSWIDSWINGAGTRKTITITLLDAKGKDAKKFVLSQCLPVKWDGPSMSVSSDAIATESLEIAHEGMKVG